ncbi:hypothetical protein [Ramlibacter sp. WS9]|uniref:hypothetical protein n=1 Tax=Ramlibacter sp. WS9 TaxID=1882741 RepID=UPI0011418FCC|nr:hypothetical protein [Ramlibacter sp. WS9]ROZ63433.1 hypothetical protein EEB15_29945 [Ramlibacter sp. WS9]
MNTFEARILLKNLLLRIRTETDGRGRFDGAVTEDEVAALKVAVAILNSLPVAPGAEGVPVIQVQSHEAVLPPSHDLVAQVDAQSRHLNTSIFELPVPLHGARLCLDFGTAMSKATLVVDGEAEEHEEIHVLELGKPGDQEEVSLVMLVSSVFIDEEGRLWFGQMAVERSAVYDDGSRLRLDNIKRRLSEDGLGEVVGPKYNPTSTSVTYGDMVLAYLMYFNWATQQCVRGLGFPSNLPRRYAMPCFPGEKMREVSHQLRRFLGEAQVLSDSFGDAVKLGLPLLDFMEAVKQVRSAPRNYAFVGQDLTEPLGAAGALLSWRAKVDMIVLVIDVGAGTSDLSLFRMAIDPAKEVNDSRESKGTARGITEAGNYLDNVLVEFMLKKAGVTSEHPKAVETRNRLGLAIRDYKETLFNEHSVFVTIPGVADITVELAEFMALDAVTNFGSSLKRAMQEVLESADESWIDWITANPNRHLTVALTGGGATLPMVKSLAEGFITIRGQTVRLIPALSFPTWLRESNPGLDQDFSRIAVSLGGARKQLINRGGEATVIGGDLRQPPRLGGYYQRGQ